MRPVNPLSSSRMSDNPHPSLRPLAAGWVKDFSPHPERVYHGDTPLGSSAEEVSRVRDAESARRSERAKRKA